MKSRDHDWERLYRRFTWLPKLIIQKTNNYSNEILVSTPGNLDGRFHHSFDSNFDRGATTLAIDRFDIEHSGLVPPSKQEDDPLADGSSIPWILKPRFQLDQRHVVVPTHHVMKAVASSILSLQPCDGADDHIHHSKQL